MRNRIFEIKPEQAKIVYHPAWRSHGGTRYTQSHFVLEMKKIQQGAENFTWVQRVAAIPCKKEVRLLGPDLIPPNHLQLRAGQK